MYGNIGIMPQSDYSTVAAEKEGQKMERITVTSWQNIPAGQTVENGYPNGYCTAPSEPGTYTLYELADEHNCHAGWEWVRNE